MLKELKLERKPIHDMKQLLFQSGFKTYNGTLFSYKCNVGNELIMLKIMIDLENNEVEVSVIDKNTLCDYAAFYNNINGENNQFALKVIGEVNYIIADFARKGIFRRVGEVNE